MTELARIGISLESKLLGQFDRFITFEGYPTRSEAIKKLIADALVKKEWTGKNNEVAGAITYVYNHHKRELINKIVNLKHNFGKIIISTQHIHLDHDNCLEIVAVKGRVKQIQDLMSRVKSVKGVKHSELTMTTTGRKIS